MVLHIFELFCKHRFSIDLSLISVWVPFFIYGMHFLFELQPYKIFNFQWICTFSHFRKTNVHVFPCLKPFVALCFAACWYRFRFYFGSIWVLFSIRFAIDSVGPKSIHADYTFAFFFGPVPQEVFLKILWRSSGSILVASGFRRRLLTNTPLTFLAGGFPICSEKVQKNLETVKKTKCVARDRLQNMTRHNFHGRPFNSFPYFSRHHHGRRF